MAEEIEKKVTFGKDILKITGNPDEVEKATRKLMEVYGPKTKLSDLLAAIQHYAVQAKAQRN